MKNLLKSIMAWPLSSKILSLVIVVVITGSAITVPLLLKSISGDNTSINSEDSSLSNNSNTNDSQDLSSTDNNGSQEESLNIESSQDQSNAISKPTITSGDPNNNNKKDKSVRDLKGREIRIVAYWDEPAKGSGVEGDIYWDRVEKIEERYNCKIKHINIPNNSYDTVKLSILSGEPMCDIFWYNNQILLDYKKSNLLYPVSDLKQFDFTESKWLRSAVDFTTIGGKQYGMAQVGANNRFQDVLLYNKSKISEDLWSLQQQGKLSQDKLYSVLKAYTDSTNKPALSPTIGDYDHVISQLWSTGGAIVSKNASGKFEFTMNKSSALNALSFAQKAISIDKTYLNTGANDWKYPLQQFLKQETAVLKCDQNLIAEAFQKVTNFDIGICLMPSSAGAKNPYSIPQSSFAIAYMPATVKAPQDVAMVWEQITFEDPRITWDKKFVDIVGTQNIEPLKLYDKEVRAGRYTLDYYWTVSDFYKDFVFQSITKIAHNESTPATEVEKIKNIMNAKIKLYN